MKHQTWGDARPSDRAGPPRVGLVSVHTSPLEQPGVGDSGGMNVYLASLARSLARRDVAVDVFTRSQGGDLPPMVRLDDGVTVHHLPAGPPTATKAELASHLCAFYLAMAAHPAVASLDVLHGHYWMSGWVGRHLRRRFGMPLVQSFHTLGRVKNDTLAPGDSPEPALRLAAEDRIARDADAVIAATDPEAEILRRRFGADPSRLHTVSAGVDLDIFNTDIDRHAARQALGGGRIILFVGRLQPLKAPDMAVRALAALDRLLPDEGVPTRLVIVGGASGPQSRGTQPEGLRQLAEHLGVADRVAILAPRPQTELAALYRAADVVIVPSHSESFGLVALEAQACGTPVVASDVGGLRSIVGSGGTLVPRRSPQAFAEAIAPYLGDVRVRAAAASAAAATASAYSWDATADATLDVYDEVLDAVASTAYESQRRGPDVDVAATIDEWFASSGTEVERVGDNGWITVLQGERKRTIPVYLELGDHTVVVESFFMAAPDERHHEVYRYLLNRNLRTYTMRFALYESGDVMLVGVLPRHAVTTDELDRMLGQLLSVADDSYWHALRMGFTGYIEREQTWRSKVGLGRNPIS